VCGALVKRENLRGHYERIHPKKVGSLGQPRGSLGRDSFVRSHRSRNILALAVLALVVVGVAFAASEFARAPAEGMHIHPVVSVMINGVAQQVPSEIGVSPGLWVDHSLDQYGIGMAPLHTHDSSGQVHVESNTARSFTLQEFLGIWGQRVDAGQVLGHNVDAGHRAYFVVDGVERPVTETIIFSDGQQIQITCGP